jgi:hypothetical protein
VTHLGDGTVAEVVSASRPEDNRCSITNAIETTTLVFHLCVQPLYVAIGEDDNRHSMVLTVIVPLAPIVAFRRARGGGVKVAAGVLAAARGARGTLTRPSTPVRSRVGASAVTLAQHGLTRRGLTRTPAVAQVRSPTTNCCEGGATSRRGQTSTGVGSTFSTAGGVAPPS